MNFSLSLLLADGRVQFDNVGGMWRLSKKKSLSIFFLYSRITGLGEREAEIGW